MSTLEILQVALSLYWKTHKRLIGYRKNQTILTYYLNFFFFLPAVGLSAPSIDIKIQPFSL